MLGTGAKAAIAALCGAAALSLASTAPAAAAEPAAKVALGRDALKTVPVFYVADADGPLKDSPAAGSAGIAYYLSRAQASIAVGMARAERASAGDPDNDLRVEATDLATAAATADRHSFVKPVSRLPAADSVPGVPLFLVRDRDGAPFTLRDASGRKRVFFYLSEADAQDFIVRVMNEIHLKPGDVQLTLVSLDPVLDSILTSKDPLVQNWAIWSSAETRLDAASLKKPGGEAQLADKVRPE